MKILLFGRSGQVGYELERSLATIGKIESHDSKTANFEDEEKIKSIIGRFCPDLIVNAAAYTLVDQAESEPNKAYHINGFMPGFLASHAKELNSWLIHYSTDYVFDGTKAKEGYTETDTPNPLNIYGKTKLMGENLIKKIAEKYLIFRTSWVFGIHGKNFLNSILKSAIEKEELRVVCDQFSGPTSAELIADITALAVYNIKTGRFSKEQSGIYHLSSEPKSNWHGLAKETIEQAEKVGMTLKTRSKNIIPIQTEEYPLPAIRPKMSCLNSSKLSLLLNTKIPSWRPYVSEFIRQKALD